MAFTESVGAATIDGLAYVGGLARITGGAAKALFVEPGRVRKLLGRSVHQAVAVGVEALPIVSLISFFIGLIFALQSAYQLRKLGALQFVAAAVAIAITRLKTFVCRRNSPDWRTVRLVRTNCAPAESRAVLPQREFFSYAAPFCVTTNNAINILRSGLSLNPGAFASRSRCRP